MAIHPVAVQNTFGRHLILWCMFLPLMALIFIPMLMPEQTVNPSEVEMVAGFNIDVNSLTEAANARFQSMFVDSGLVPRTEQFFAPSPTSSQSSATTAIQSFGEQWVHGVWLMVYKATWRAYVLLRIFFLPLLVLSTAAAIDGFGVRARKKYRFETTNPVFFYSSTHLVVLMAGMFAFLPLAPITFSMTMLVGLLVAMAAGVWWSSSNFQTGT